MSDIENAIENLKELNENYFSSDFDETNEAIILGIKALEKQTPKKFERDSNYKDDIFCPECGEPVEETSCCSGCGQKIDWSENEIDTI